jgi:ubiquinone/menaquinone biosynthesis C-methylase UbiE
MLLRLFLVLLALAAIIAAFILRYTRWLRPFPASLAWLLDSPLRRLFFSRRHAVENSGIEAGMRVLELGPGNGFVSEVAAERIGSRGSLICVDVQPAMLSKVRSRGIEPAPGLVCASADALPFADGCFDVALLVSVLGEFSDREEALRECRRVLRSGGRLAVTEALPDPDYVLTGPMRQLAARVGLEAEERKGNWVQRTHCFTVP